MNAVWTVLKREYLERVRKRSFLLATIGGPLVLIALVFGSGMMAARGAQGRSNIAILDLTDVLITDVSASLEEAEYTIVSPEGAGDEEALRTMVREGDISGYLILDELTLNRGEATIVSESRPSAIRRMLMQTAVSRAVVKQRFGSDSSAEDITTLVEGGALAFEPIDSNEASERKEIRTGLAFAGAMLLYFALLFYGVYVMQAVLEEKTSRMAEIVVSSVRPWQLMLGKIIGVGLVGMTQIAVWVALIIVATVLGGSTLAAARPELADLLSAANLVPAVLTVVYFVIFFILGYLLYSALYAAVGAMCSTEEETRQLQLPVTMMLVVPFVMMMSAIDSGADTSLLAGMSLFPLFTPLLMFARAASGVAPMWQIGLSVVLTALSIGAVAWVAGRIYRVGILMQGKRPTLPELWRWVREA